MRRLLVHVTIAVSLVLQAIVGASLGPARAAYAATGTPPTSSYPPDRAVHARAPVPQDLNPTGRRAPALAPAAPSFVRDPIVSNTDTTLKNGGPGGSEPSIAINPNNPNQIAITAFAGGWGANAPLYYSADGGATWTKEFSIPVPPNVPGAAGCPCDQTIDFDRGNRLFGTFLTNAGIYSGETTDPTDSTKWSWLTSGTPPTAQTTNSAAQPSVDQPWLIVNRDPSNASQDDVYVAYLLLGTATNDIQVAEAQAAAPPTFNTHVATGSASGPGNPGHRLAADRGSGATYDLWQSNNGDGTVSLFLNRTTNGGTSWSLNGSSTGIKIDTVTQNYGGKFGTVNALLGGVDHVAVDSASGAVYVAYGTQDSTTKNNRIKVARLQKDGSGNLNIAATSFASGQVQAALPSVAVTQNGTVGVLYTTFDGFSTTPDPANPGNNFPIFTAHFATSTDSGATFTDSALQTFLAPDTSTNAGDSQRDFGDYEQVKATGNTFYGVFSGNGSPFGTANSQIDPIFFKVFANQAAHATSLTFTGTSGDFNDPGTVAARLTDSTNAQPVAGATVAIQFDGTLACRAVTDGGGTASCPVDLNRTPGTVPIQADFAGNDSFLPSSASGTFTINREDTALTYTGPTSGDFNDPLTLSARLTDPDGGQPIGGKVLTFTLGAGDTCTTGPTDAGGSASCAITPTQPAGTVPLTVAFAGDTFFRPATTSVDFPILHEEATLQYTGDTTADFHDPATVSARLTDPDGGQPIGGKVLTFTLGAGDTCTSAPTDANGSASCVIVPTQPAATVPLTVSFAGDAFFVPASTTASFTITREETTTTYTGPGLLRNGESVTLSGVLREDGTTPIAGRTLTLTIGSGATAQSCSGPTDATGRAQCVITVVSQPLNAAATVPVTAAFAGDPFYLPSKATATLRLQFMTGRAFGLSANVSALLPLVNIPPTPDTGQVRTASAASTTTPCTATISALVVTAHSLCANVTTTLAPGTSTATASVADATIGVPGLPVISVSGVKATSRSACGSATGTVTLTLTIGGVATTVSLAPNSVIDLGAAKLILNEQKPVPGADFGLTVNAVHLVVSGLVVNGDVVIGSATSDIHSCA